MSHLDEGTLHAHLDGELDAVEEADLGEHLATCAECRARLDVERATRNRAHEILRYADPVGIVAPDFEELRARRTARPLAATNPAGSRVRPLILPWAASIVLALGVGWFAQALLTGNGAGGARFTIESERAREAEVSAPAPASTTTENEFSAATTPAPDMPVAAAPTAGGAAQEPPAAPPPGLESGARTARVLADSPVQGERLARAEPSSARGHAGDEPEPESPEALARAPEPSAADAAPAARHPEPAVELQAMIAANPTTADTEQAERVLGYQASREVLSAQPSPAARTAAGAAAPPVPAESLWRRGWANASAAEAANALGSPPLVLSSLPVIGYAVAADTARLVRVTQQLPGGEPLEIYQWPSDSAAAGIEVVVRAAVSADSLVRLRDAIGRGEQ